MPLPTDTTTTTETTPTTPSQTDTASDTQSIDDAAAAELNALMGNDEGDDAGTGDTDEVTNADDTTADTETGDAGTDTGEGAASDNETTETATEATATEETTTTPETKPEDTERQRQQAEAEQQQAQRITAFQQGYSKIKADLDAGNFEPMDQGAEAFKVLLEGIALLDEELSQVKQFTQQAKAKTADDQWWDDWGRKPENATIGVKVSREIFEDEIAKAKQEFPGADAKTLAALATRGWKSRLATRKGIAARAAQNQQQQQSNRKPVKPPVVTKGGASAAPPKDINRVPSKVAKTVDDKLEANEYGNIADEF